MPFTSKFNRAGTQRLTRRFRSCPHLELLENRTLPSVYTPAQIMHAYGIDQISFDNGIVKGNGAGQTIALVDAYYDPTIQSDLATFNSTFGLPQLDGLNGDGTLTQLDLSNKTLSPSGDDWTLETALDVEWAHAVAPKANILLVEAANDSQDATTGEPTALLNAVHTAATTRGVSTVSMSWGISEVPAETNWDSFFTTPGVTFVAASGDSGAGTIWPAVSPNVVSVGGTTLRLTSSNTIASETGWGHGNSSFYYGGSGGGFSQYEPLPSYQSGITTVDNGWKLTSFGVRLNPDVAYVANPNTGVSVYDSIDGGWNQVGGTSVGAPQWAALFAIADQGRALAGLPSLSSAQTLSTLYGTLYPNQAEFFHEITRGSTGTYYVVNNYGEIVGVIPVRAGPGYNMVTGLGTPIANVLIPALATASADPAHSGTTATFSGASGGKSGSSRSQVIAAGFLGIGGFFSVGQPSLASAVPQISTGQLSQTLPPASGNNVGSPAVSSSQALTLPSIKEESGGGNDSFVDGTTDSTNAAPGNNTPTDSAPQQSPKTPTDVPSNATDRSGQIDASSGRLGRDRYFASGSSEFLVQPASADSEDAAAPRGPVDPMAMAAALSLLAGNYWGAKQSKLEERDRALRAQT